MVPTLLLFFHTLLKIKNSAGKGRNHVYRYELSEDVNRLKNPKLLLDLPAVSPDPHGTSNHNGDKIFIGPDRNLYTVIGDVGGHKENTK
jgi:hypothetical protein